MRPPLTTFPPLTVRELGEILVPGRPLTALDVLRLAQEHEPRWAWRRRRLAARDAKIAELAARFPELPVTEVAEKVAAALADILAGRAPPIGGELAAEVIALHGRRMLEPDSIYRIVQRHRKNQ